MKNTEISRRAEIRCPYCEKRSFVPKEFTGKPVSCIQCKQPFRALESLTARSAPFIKAEQEEAARIKATDAVLAAANRDVDKAAERLDERLDLVIDLLDADRKAKEKDDPMNLVNLLMITFMVACSLYTVLGIALHMWWTS